MSDNAENQQIVEINAAQEKALDIFFKSFSRALTSAQMYFAEHPSFELALNEFKDKLGELSVFWPELVVSIADKKLYINSMPFREESSRYQDLAKQFHRYKVTKIIFNVTAELEDLKSLVLIFSRSDDIIRSGKDIFEELSKLKTIEVKELDYSSILSAHGNFTQNIWDTLFGDEDQELLQQNADYLVENIEEIVEEFSSLGQNERLATRLLDRYGSISYALEKVDTTKKRIFSRSIMKLTLSQNAQVQSRYINDERFENVRVIVSESLDKNQVFSGIVKQITETNRINPLLTQFYNCTLHEDISEDDLAANLSDFLKNRASNEELSKVSNVVNELFLQDSSDKFVSSFYSQMLTQISQKQAAEEEALKDKYRASFSEESLLDDFWYTLLDVLHYTDSKVALVKILEILETHIPEYIEKGLYDALCDFVIALESRRKTLHLKETINQVSSRLGIENIIKDVLMPNFKELTNKAAFSQVVTCLAQPEEALLERFFSERDSSSRSQVIEVLLSLPVEKVIKALDDYMEEHKNNQLLIKEAMLLFEGLWVDEAAKILVKTFDHYKGNSYMQGEIGKVLIQNPYCPKEVFEPYLDEKSPVLRRLAITVLAQKADKEEKEYLMKKIFEVDNWFGGSDDYLKSNAETVGFLKLNEAVPYLEKILFSKSFFFKERREKLRVTALEAILEIDLTAVFRFKEKLENDTNENIRKIMDNL